MSILYFQCFYQPCIFFLYRVAGWDMKTCPRLNDKIHIGDQLLKINDKRVKNSADAQKMYKSAEDSVMLTVQRLPYAQVIAIHRQETKQPIGIQRDGGTSKVPNQICTGFAVHPLKRALLCGHPKVIQLYLSQSIHVWGIFFLPLAQFGSKCDPSICLSI